jgi:hypothetical protein
MRRQDRLDDVSPTAQMQVRMPKRSTTSVGGRCNRYLSSAGKLTRAVGAVHVAFELDVWCAVTLVSLVGNDRHCALTQTARL